MAMKGPNPMIPLLILTVVLHSFCRQTFSDLDCLVSEFSAPECAFEPCFSRDFLVM